MAERFTSLSPDLAQWWREQPVFFVATAPGGDAGHVNLSPKGQECFRVFDRIIELDEVPNGYRAMNERKAIKVMVEP